METGRILSSSMVTCRSEYLRYGLLLLFLFSGMQGCGRTGNNSLTAARFSEWYVAPSAVFPADTKIPAQTTIDSLVKSVRQNSRPGTTSLVLADTVGNPFTVGIETPRRIQKYTSYPCVIYLHGGIGTDRNDKGVAAYKMLSMLNDSLQVFIASPSANRTTPWWSPAGLSRILQTLRYMALHYPVNPDKIFLAGVSDGATGCWAAANCIAGPFAGFFPTVGIR